jgi:hypothetical protein
MTSKGIEELIYIIDYEHTPTEKQCKDTNGYRFSDYKFKNIALSMFKSIKVKRRENIQTSTSNIILAVFNGFKMDKARKILLEISKELKNKIDTKIGYKDKKIENKEVYDRSKYKGDNIYKYKREIHTEITQGDIDDWENI